MQKRADTMLSTNYEVDKTGELVILPSQNPKLALPCPNANSSRFS